MDTNESADLNYKLRNDAVNMLEAAHEYWESERDAGNIYTGDKALVSMALSILNADTYVRLPVQARNTERQDTLVIEAQLACRLG